MIAEKQNWCRTCGVPLKAFVCILLGIAWLSGCKPTPVVVKGDPGKAVAVLKGVLKDWQDGKDVTALEDADPSIVVREHDWEGGAKLKAFEVESTATDEGGSWRVYATITVVGPGLPTEPQRAAYSVIVEPKIVINRKDTLE